MCLTIISVLWQVIRGSENFLRRHVCFAFCTSATIKFDDSTISHRSATRFAIRICLSLFLYTVNDSHFTILLGFLFFCRFRKYIPWGYRFCFAFSCHGQGFPFYFALQRQTFMHIFNMIFCLVTLYPPLTRPPCWAQHMLFVTDNKNAMHISLPYSLWRKKQYVDR